jgi:hypothetical protein
MKRLLPAVVLAGAIIGLILSRHADHTSSRTPASPPITGQPATVSGSSRLSVPSSEPSASVVPLTDEISRGLRDGSARERDRAFNELLPRLITRDPASAGHLALSWEPGALREEFLGHVIRLWSAADIGGALTWLTSLLDETDRNLASATSTAQVAQADRAGALDLAQALRVGLDDGSLEHLAQLWTEEEPGAALKWATTQPAGVMRDRLLARIAHVRAQQEPAEAAGLVLNHLTPGAARDEAILGVVRQWGVRDPVAATTWVVQFPAGPLQVRALAELETARRLR